MAHIWLFSICLCFFIFLFWNLFMSVCPLLKLTTTVFRISCWFQIVPLVKMFITCHRYARQREWDGWSHKPGLTHLSLVHSPGPSMVLCVHYIVSYNVEDYVMSFMSHAQKSYLAQLRCGILHLHIETGRWQGTQLYKRILKVCNSNSVENEVHFIFHCNKYNTRFNFYQQICNKIPSFLNNSDENKFKIIMEKGNVNVFSRFICNIYKKTKNKMYYLKRTIKIKAHHNMQVGPCGLDVSHLV